MKKTINLFLAAFVLVAAVSCVKENIVENNENVETAYATFTMTAPRAVSEAPVDENDADSKTGLAEDGKTVVWKNGDMVDAVIWSNDASHGCYDVVVSEMECELSQDQEKNVIFQGSFNGTQQGDYWRPFDYHNGSTHGYALDQDCYSSSSMAVYPSTVEYSMSGTTRVYSYDLPKTQIPVAGTFQDDIALLSATFDKTTLVGKYSGGWSPAPGVPKLTFKNACALIRVNLPKFSDRNIVSVKVEGTEPMAGQPANLTENDGRLVPNGSWTSSSTYVELKSEPEIAAGTYYMVVWPGSHSKLTLTVTDANGWYWTKEVEGTYSFVESQVFKLDINAANAEFADPNARVDNSTPKVGSYYYTDGTISLYHDLEGKTLAGVIFSVNDDYSEDTELMTAFENNVTGLVVYKEQYNGRVTRWWSNKNGYGYCQDKYIGYTATNSFETSSDYKEGGYLYGHNQNADSNCPVQGGWYIPGQKEFAVLGQNLSQVNIALSKAGCTSITGDYWISHKSSSAYASIGYVTGETYSSVSYVSGDTYYAGNVSKNARLICAFYKQKEWTPGEVTGVTLDQTSADIEVGGSTLTLNPTISAYGDVPATNSNVSWSSSAESIATVSNGVVTAVGEGTAVITVTTEDGGYQATCTVNVTDPTARKTPAVGDYVYSDGSWSNGSKAAEGDPIGLVCYIGDLSTDSKLSGLGYNCIVADMKDISSKIYNGVTNTPFEIPTGNSTTNLNKVSNSTEITDKIYGYTLYNAWRVCPDWDAIKSHLIVNMSPNTIPIEGKSTCWYVPSLGEYKQILSMQNNSELTKNGYNNISGEYATLYMQDSTSSTQRGYIYIYDSSTNAMLSTPRYAGANTFAIRKVFATTLADHE